MRIGLGLTPAAARRAGSIAASVLFDGDSLSTGYGAGGGAQDYPEMAWPALLVASVGSGWSVTTVPVAGQTVSQMLGGLSGHLGDAYDESKSANLAVLLGGFNDRVTSGVSATVAHNRIRWWHDLARARGFATVACTIPGGLRAAVGDVNTLMSAGHEDYADTMVDFDGEGLHDNTDTDYFQADATHLTTAGNVLAESIARPVVSGYLSSPTAALTPPAADTVVCGDDFAAANGTGIGGRSLPTVMAGHACNWEFVNGGDIGEVQSNALTAAADAWYLTNARYADMTVEVVAALSSTNGYVIPLVRGVDGGDCWAFYWLGSGSLVLFEFIDGVATNRGSSTWTYDTEPHTLKVVCDGEAITCYLDGAQKIEYVTATAHRYAVGAGLRLTADSRAESIEVRKT